MPTEQCNHLENKWLYVGRSRPWGIGQDLAATRWLPAVQQVMEVNGRFRRKRRTGPDPKRSVALAGQIDLPSRATRPAWCPRPSPPGDVLLT